MSLNTKPFHRERTPSVFLFDAQVNAAPPLGAVYLPQPFEASPLPKSSARNIQTQFGLGGISGEREDARHQMVGSNSAAFSQNSGLVATAKLMSRISDESGGVVKIDLKHSCLPMLVGADGEVVLLRDFVEEIDGIIDYDELQERLPGLNFVQIAGGIEFLRRLSQFNIRGIDIDAVEAQAIETSAPFQSVITQALEDKEVARVLNADQSDR